MTESLRSRVVEAMAQAMWFHEGHTSDESDDFDWYQRYTVPKAEDALNAALEVLGETFGTKPMLVDPHRLLAVLRP